MVRKGTILMSKQWDLQCKFLKRVGEIERIIDGLKSAGPCPLDGWNALKNVEAHLNALAGRCDVERITGHQTRDQ